MDRGAAVWIGSVLVANVPVGGVSVGSVVGSVSLGSADGGVDGSWMCIGCLLFRPAVVCASRVAVWV